MDHPSYESPQFNHKYHEQPTFQQDQFQTIQEADELRLVFLRDLLLKELTKQT